MQHQIHLRSPQRHLRTPALQHATSLSSSWPFMNLTLPSHVQDHSLRQVTSPTRLSCLLKLYNYWSISSLIKRIANPLLPMMPICSDALSTKRKPEKRKRIGVNFHCGWGACSATCQIHVHVVRWIPAINSMCKVIGCNHEAPSSSRYSQRRRDAR